MFQENGYITEQDFSNRLQLLQCCGIQPDSMREYGNHIILKRNGSWSHVGCQSDDFSEYFEIYTGDRDRFNWVNDKLEIACGLMDYPFLRMEWSDDEKSVEIS